MTCKYRSIYTESVPMPFGFGNCSMCTGECVYDGNIEIPDECPEYETTCPAYESGEHKWTFRRTKPSPS